MKPALQVIICSTRPGRVGVSVARWFDAFARERDQFDVKLVDLAEFDLPVYDEPVHPAMQDYKHEHTKNWSRSVAAADAYAFVMPEYNYGPTPALVNALDYVYKEWNYKPCGIVSYGGASGGLRAAQAVKLQLTTLKMVPLMEGVMVPMVSKQIDDDGKFHSNDLIDKSANTLLDELLYWTRGLKAMRDKGR